MTKQIENLEKKMDRKFNKVYRDFRDFRKEVRDKLQPFHDYLVGVEAVKEEHGNKSDAKHVNISPEAWNVIKWLILIIGGLLGVKLL